MTCASPSTRRAWIEIISLICSGKTGVVALHPEGVDRNYYTLSPTPLKPVALHPEGVDRNFFGYDIANLDRGSPSTRRAWIEMIIG